MGLDTWIDNIFLPNDTPDIYLSPFLYKKSHLSSTHYK